MEAKEKNCLQQCHTLLMNDLDCDEVADYLYENKILTYDIMKKITGEHLNPAKRRLLLDAIRNCGPAKGVSAFNWFLKALYNTEQFHIETELKKKIASQYDDSDLSSQFSNISLENTQVKEIYQSTSCPVSAGTPTNTQTSSRETQPVVKSAIPEGTIKEFRQLTHAIRSIQCKIVNVNNYSFYYIACVKCRCRLLSDKNGLFCKRCGHQERSRKVLSLDLTLEDETGALSCWFYENTAIKLLNTPQDEFLLLSFEEQLEKIKNIMDRQISINIKKAGYQYTAYCFN